MTATENKKLIQAGFESWAQGGDFFHLLANDVRWTISGSGPISGTYASRQEFISRAIKPLAERLAGPIQPTVETIDFPGSPIDLQFVFSLRDDKIASLEID